MGIPLRARSVTTAALCLAVAVYAVRFVIGSYFPAHVPEEMVLHPEDDPNALPAFTEEEYLARLAEDPDSLAILDVRWYNLFPSGAQNRFANSLGDFRTPEQMAEHLYAHRDELEDKEIVFVCYGGNKARIFQQEINDVLKERGLDLDLVGFKRMAMLHEKPDWLAQRVRYYPATVTDHWEDRGEVAIVALDVPADPTPRFWEDAKRELAASDGPIVVRTDADPGEVERAIYPLRSSRYYEIRDWKTPPAWFATAVHGVARVVPYPALALLVTLGVAVALARLRLGEVELGAAGLTWPRRLARPALLASAFVFVYYLSFCFVENHFYFHTRHYDITIYGFVVLFVLLVAYRRGAARDALAGRLAASALRPREQVPAWQRRLGSELRVLARFAIGGALFVILAALLGSVKPGMTSDRREAYLAYFVAGLVGGENPLPGTGPPALFVWGPLLVPFALRLLVKALRRLPGLARAIVRPASEGGRRLRASLRSVGRYFSWKGAVLGVPLGIYFGLGISMSVFEPHHTFAPLALVYFCLLFVHTPLTDLALLVWDDRPRGRIRWPRARPLNAPATAG